MARHDRDCQVSLGRDREYQGQSMEGMNDGGCKVSIGNAGGGCQVSIVCERGIPGEHRE